MPVIFPISYLTFLWVISSHSASTTVQKPRLRHSVFSRNGPRFFPFPQEHNGDCLYSSDNVICWHLIYSYVGRWSHRRQRSAKLERRGSTSEVHHHRCSWSQRSWTNNRRLAQCFPDLGRSQLRLRGWSQTTYQVGCKIKWWLHGGENDLDRWDCRPSVSDQRNEEGCCQSTPWNLAKAPKTLEFRIYASFFPCGTYTFASVYRPISSSLPRERELGGNRYWHKEHYDSWTEVVSPH